MPFPPLPFDGLVSTHDECDDGIHLRRELSGKRWDELSPEVLFHGSIGLPLLEPSALIAFLPAWLLRSMETRDVDDPIVLEFTLYFLCPGDEDDGWDEKSIVETVGFFNSGQRDAVADFLRFVVNWAKGRTGNEGRSLACAGGNQIRCVLLVAGVGFEPSTFGL
jgi:hypothetical protein